MGGAYQLNTTFGNGSCRLGFKFSANFIDNDYLRHVVFHCFNHYRMLSAGSGYLHPPRMSNSGMRNITVTGNLI